jgi:archaellum biogenesis protein FlaJ (TadC family)
MKKIIFWIVLFFCILAMSIIYGWMITLATVLVMAIAMLSIGELYGVYLKYKANKKWKEFRRN